MKYESTIHIVKAEDGYYYVHAGWCDSIVGEKNNYFPIVRDMNSREAKAHSFLGLARFPQSENKHETYEQAEDWMSLYVRYVRRVSEMPSSLKVGHSCAWW